MKLGKNFTNTGYVCKKKKNWNWVKSAQLLSINGSHETLNTDFSGNQTRLTQ